MNISFDHDLQQHTIRLTAQQAADRISSHASPVAKAVRSFLLTVGRSRAESIRALPIFEVRYPYGAEITGPRSDRDKFSKVLTPCPSNSACDPCKQLLASFPNHRPLTFILEGSCEEYVQYQQFQPPELRRAPLRFYSKGDVIGINRLLNQLYLPSKPTRSIFGPSARRISAGSLSVFFSASLSNPRLMERLRDKTEAELQAWIGKKRLDNISDKDLGKLLDREHSRFFKIMAAAAIRCHSSKVWRCDLLLIPVEPLAQLLQKWEGQQEERDFLLAMLAEFFIAMRNQRSDFLRQMMIFNQLAAKKKLTPYAKGTVHYLIELVRGEFPGFVPHNPEWGDDFGPASAVYDYMEEIGVPNFLKEFPGLLRPIHLNSSIAGRVYYSMERPTLLAPLGKERSVRSVTAKVYDGLKKIYDDIPALFDSTHCEFFISAGKSQGPQVSKPSDLSKEKIRFTTYQEDKRIKADFACQLEPNKRNGWADLANRDFHRARGGFMASFVRISLQAKSQSKRNKTK